MSWICHTCPIYTELKNLLVNTGFTADAISRSTFVHAVQTSMEQYSRGCSILPSNKTTGEQVTICPVVTAEITTLFQITVTDREKHTAKICSLQ